MTAAATLLVAALLLQEGNPAPACPLTDNRCKADRFARSATSATSPDLRAKYLFGAFRSRLAHFDQSGASDDLCAARRYFDQSLAVEGLREGQRSAFEVSRAELEERERRHRPQCRRERRRITSSVTRATPAEPEPGASTDSSAKSRASDVPAEFLALDAPKTLFLPLDVDSNSSTRAPSGSTERPSIRTEPVPASVGSSVDVVAVDRSHRSLVIAGGVSLGVGLGLVGLASYTGARMVDLRRKGTELVREAPVPADSDTMARDQDLRVRYTAMSAWTISAAIAGGVAVVVGAALVGVGKRRKSNGGSQTALSPVPGGIVFSARF